MTVYLDHNATHPMLDAARAAMDPWLGRPANPSSAHQYGQQAASAVERARAQVAELLGRSPQGVVFTSGATEALHQAVLGFSASRIAVGATEHPAALAAVARHSAPSDVLPVDASGRVDPAQIAASTDLLVLQAANHETGVIQPLEAVQARCRSIGARWVLDATQAAGRIPTLPDADAVVLSAHKLGGPVGVGALVLPDGDPFPALLSGGSQERGRRAGTVNVAGIVGFGAACAAATEERQVRTQRWRALQTGLEAALSKLDGTVVGAGAPRLPQTTCVVFGDLNGEALVQSLDLKGFAVSSGAACASGSVQASPVLQAMGVSNAEGGLRISLGVGTTRADLSRLVRVLPEVMASAALWED